LISADKIPTFIARLACAAKPNQERMILFADWHCLNHVEKSRIIQLFGRKPTTKTNVSSRLSSHDYIPIELLQNNLFCRAPIRERILRSTIERLSTTIRLDHIPLAHQTLERSLDIGFRIGIAESFVQVLGQIRKVHTLCSESKHAHERQIATLLGSQLDRDPLSSLGKLTIMTIERYLLAKLHCFFLS